DVQRFDVDPPTNAALHEIVPVRDIRTILIVDVRPIAWCDWRLDSGRGAQHAIDRMGMLLRCARPLVEVLETVEAERRLNIGKPFQVFGLEWLERLNLLPEIDVGVPIKPRRDPQNGKRRDRENAISAEEALRLRDLEAVFNPLGPRPRQRVDLLANPT